MYANDGLSAHTASGMSRREQIVYAAASLFSEQGYHGTSMQDIGTRVGLLKGSLYAHVASKEELLLEILSTADRTIVTALQTALSGGMPAADRLRRALETFMATTEALGPLARVYLLEPARLTGEPAIWMRQARERQRALWLHLILAGIQDGSFRPDLDASLAAWLVESVLWFAHYEPPAAGRGGDLTDRLCALVLDSLR